MPTSRFVCSHHFRFVVTSSDGTPTCRECGLRPTAAELAAGIDSLRAWEAEQLKAARRLQGSR